MIGHAPLEGGAPTAPTPAPNRIVESTGWLRGYLRISVVVMQVLLVVAAIAVAIQSMSLPYTTTLAHVALLIGLASIIWGVRRATQGLERGEYSALTIVAVMMCASFVDAMWDNTITLSLIVPAIIASVVVRLWLRISRERFADHVAATGAARRPRPFYLRSGVVSAGLMLGWLGLAVRYFDGRAARSGEQIATAVPLGQNLKFGYASRQSPNPFDGERVMTIIVWRRRVEPPVEWSPERHEAEDRDAMARMADFSKHGWMAEGSTDALMVDDPKNHALIVGGANVPVPYRGAASVVLVETSGWPLREKVVAITSVPSIPDPPAEDLPIALAFRALLQQSPVAAAFIHE